MPRELDVDLRDIIFTSTLHYVTEIIGMRKIEVIHSLIESLAVIFVVLLLYDVIHAKENVFMCIQEIERKKTNILSHG